jgi:hypothetical protein
MSIPSPSKLIREREFFPVLLLLKFRKQPSRYDKVILDVFLPPIPHDSGGGGWPGTADSAPLPSLADMYTPCPKHGRKHVCSFINWNLAAKLLAKIYPM